MFENKSAQETAEKRFKAITPALVAMEEGADAAMLAQAKGKACEQNGISRRTLDRWLASHARNGFEGLKPAPKTRGGPNAISEGVLGEAILLRREAPSRSVAQIIEILEMEGKAAAGAVKRTTLQDRLAASGYSSRQMKMYRQSGVAARRFARLERGDLWAADIKFGPFVAAGGGRKQIYLLTFLDDATRYVVHAEFYDNMEQAIVEDCLRKAIMKEGCPRRLYFDNGRQFRNRWMERACAKLGIKLLFTQPYSPESHGKSERFNRTVDSFLAEARLKKLGSLDEYNHYLKVWIQECYHSRMHGSLMDTPENAYKMSKEPLRYADAEAIADAFLHCETRKVDKAGCISFGAKLYEVGLSLIGQTVDVVFDPADTARVTVEHKPTGYCAQARPLAIGPHAGKRPKLPDMMLPQPCGTSRLLDAKAKAYQGRQDAARRAIRYSGIGAMAALPAPDAGGGMPAKDAAIGGGADV